MDAGVCAACGAPVHHIGVLVKVDAPDGLGAVEANVRDVAEALAIDTVASAVARLVATVRVRLVAQPLEVELGTRDRASGVVAVSIIACSGVCVARQWAGRRIDRHENDEGVRVLHGTIFGHLVGVQGTLGFRFEVGFRLGGEFRLGVGFRLGTGFRIGVGLGSMG